MKKEFKCLIDEDIIEKFSLALNLTKEEQSYAVEELMRNYIASSFSKVSREYSYHASIVNTTSNDEPKALSRIPLWAKRNDQINHKILRAYFQIEAELGSVPLSEFEKRCLDKLNHPDIFIPTFKSNYAQMKMDAPKSHGKVFEEISDKVVIWDRIKPAILEYKRYFK